MDPNKILLHKDKKGDPFHFKIYDPSIFISLFEFILKNFPEFDLKTLLNAENDKNEHILFHLISTNKYIMWSKLCELLDWIKRFDSTLFRNMINLHKNRDDKNLLRHSFYYGYQNIFNQISYLETKFPDFSIIDLFKGTDKFGSNILVDICSGENENEIDVSIQNLNWIKDKDFHLLQELIFHKNMDGATFIHQMCQKGYKKEMLPQFFKRLYKYFEANSLNFIELFSQRDNREKTFINYHYQSPIWQNQLVKY